MIDLVFESSSERHSRLDYQAVCHTSFAGSVGGMPMRITTKTHVGLTRPTVPPSALALLESARRGLEAGKHDPSASSRLVTSQLAALRTAAAVVAAGSDPRTAPRNKGPQNIWDLLPGMAPTLSEWAA